MCATEEVQSTNVRRCPTCWTSEYSCR